jgi:hypothetical protein
LGALSARQSDTPRLSERQVQAYLDAYFQLKSRYFRVMLPLFIASAPQAVLYASFLEALTSPRLDPLWFLVTLTPWLVYFAVTFIRIPPPITPRGFRRILLFVTYWYATSTLVLLILATFRSGPMIVPAPYGHAVLWVCALVGWLGVPTLIRCSSALAQIEPAS